MTPAPCELLAELVAIPSPSGDERRIASVVAGLLESAGLAVERLGEHGETVLALLDFGPVRADPGAAAPAGPRVLFTSHLDTVPPGEGWTRDPYEARWRDGRLVGRGANDAKASVAAMITAFLAHAAAPARHRGAPATFFLALNAREETDNSGMARVLERLAPQGTPDAVVCGEPTGLEVVRAQMGLAVLVARWRGRSCHAAHVARVAHDNALLHAARDLARFEGSQLTVGREHPLLGATGVVPTVLRAGERHNVVPDAAELVLDARLAPPVTAEDVVASLARLLPGAALTIRSSRLQAIETAEDHPVVQAALEVAGRPRAIGSATLSDLALCSGIPAVKVGPGETARSHVPDEYVTEAEVEAGAAFYRALMPRLAEVLGRRRAAAPGEVGR